MVTNLLEEESLAFKKETCKIKNCRVEREGESKERKSFS